MEGAVGAAEEAVAETTTAGAAGVKMSKTDAAILASRVAIAVALIEPAKGSTSSTANDFASFTKDAAAGGDEAKSKREDGNAAVVDDVTDVLPLLPPNTSGPSALSSKNAAGAADIAEATATAGVAVDDAGAGLRAGVKLAAADLRTGAATGAGDAGVVGVMPTPP